MSGGLEGGVTVIVGGRAYGPRPTLALAAAEAGEDILATLLIAVVKLDDGVASAAVGELAEVVGPVRARKTLENYSASLEGVASGTEGVLLDMPEDERRGMMEQAERTLALVRRLLSRAESMPDERDRQGERLRSNCCSEPCRPASAAEWNARSTSAGGRTSRRCSSMASSSPVDGTPAGRTLCGVTPHGRSGGCSTPGVAARLSSATEKGACAGSFWRLTRRCFARWTASPLGAGS